VIVVNGTLAGTGLLTNSANLTVKGTTSITSPFAQNGGLTVQGDSTGLDATLSVGSSFTNTGTVALQSNGTFQSNLTVVGTLTNAANGTIAFNAGSGGSRAFTGSLANNGTVTIGLDAVSFTGSITNSGTFTKTAGTGTTTVAAAFNNTGTVAVDSGTLNLSGAVSQLSGSTLTGGTWDVLNASVLSLGGATITTNQATITLSGFNFSGNASATFTGLGSLAQNSGSLSLLNGVRFTDGVALTNSGSVLVDASTVFAVNGNFTQTAAGSLALNIAAGPSSGAFGSLHVVGTATLAGTLTANDLNGFTPTPDSYFPIIVFTSVAGDFGTKNLQYAAGQSYATNTTSATYFLNTQLAATHIAVSQQPTNTVAGQTITAVKVTFLDSLNNAVLTDNTDAATLSLASGPSGAALGGTLTITANAGIATFTNLMLQQAGTYTLGAAATGFTSVTSNSFAITPAAATQLILAPIPSTVTAGTAETFSVMAKDPFGNIDTNDNDPLQITSSDGQALLPANAKLTSGQGSFQITLKTAGTQSFAVADTAKSLNASQTGIIVAPAAATKLILSGVPSTVAAGAPQTLKVVAVDPFGNTDTNDNDALQITSSDGQAVLPAGAALANGQGSFQITLKTAPTQSITVTDTAKSVTASQAGITVTPLAATHLVLSGVPTTVTAGAAQTLTVKAEDQFGNVDTSDKDALQIASSDGQAVLPANATLTNGQGSFQITLKTATPAGGPLQSITVNDTAKSLSASQAGITVNPASVSQLVVSGIATPVTAGAAQTISVVAKDGFGNIDTGDNDALNFTSSDTQAGLPTNAVLTNGQGTFQITLKTAGTQQLNVSDTAKSLTVSQTGITVNPASARQFVFSGLPNTVTAGVQQTLTVTAKDDFGNTDPTDNDALLFTSTDLNATLPVSVSLTQGTGSFNVTFTTSGPQSVSVTDIAKIFTNSQAVTVEAAAATQLVLSGIPSTVTAGITKTLTVTAEDQFGNIDTNDSNALQITNSGGQAKLPANPALSKGIGSFPITFETAAVQSLTVNDTAKSLTASQTGITVTPGVATQFVLTGVPSTVTAGVQQTLSVVAKDAFGNTDVNDNDALQITSSDGQADLPTTAALTNGQGSFQITLKTATVTPGKFQSITVTDAVTQVAGKQTGITVNPAAAAKLVLTGISSPTTAGDTQTLTIAATDAFGNTDTNDNDTLQITSTDDKAVLVGTTALSQGVATVQVRFKTAGVQSISVTDTDKSLTAEQDGIAVQPGKATQLVLSGFPSNVKAGVANALTVQALDAYGNRDTNDDDDLQISSSDAQAVLPAAPALTNGQGTFTITLQSPGTQSLTVQDSDKGLTASQTGITVASTAPQVIFTGLPASTIAGTVIQFTISVLTPLGQPDTTYDGTVHFSSSDTKADLPVDATLTNGTGMFTVTFKTAGSHSLVVSDTKGLFSASQAIDVSADKATHLELSQLGTSAVAGSVQTLVVTALDAFGNADTAFTGSIRFASTDRQATLPDDFTFTKSDQGTHSFTLSFGTAGTQTVTVAPLGLTTLDKVQHSIDVVPGAATSILVTGFPSGATIDVAGTARVTMLDAFHNVATNFTGAVTFTSSDSKAVLPASYTFTATDKGVHDFTVRFRDPGTQTLTVAQVDDSSVRGTDDVKVFNPALAATGAANAVIGASYALTLSATNLGTDVVKSWTINWGDNTMLTVFATLADGSRPRLTDISSNDPKSTDTAAVVANTLVVNHTYATGDPKGFTIQVSVNDSRIKAVSLAPIQIGFIAFNVPDTVTVGKSFAVGFTTANPGVTSIKSWTIDWNDGIVDSDMPGTITSDRHTYANGPLRYEVKISAVDDHGGTLTFIKGISAEVPDTIAHNDADVSQGEQQKVAVTGVSATLSKNSAGVSGVHVAEYSTNTSGTLFPGSIWVDVSLTNVTDDDKVVITLDYTGHTIAGAPTIFYFDKDAQTWKAVPKDLYQLHPDSNTITITLDGTTTPRIDQLGGTIFTVSVSTATVETPTTVNSLTTSVLQAEGGQVVSFVTNSQLSLSLTALQQSQLSSSRSSLTGEGAGQNGGGEEEEGPVGEEPADLSDLWQLINEVFPPKPGNGGAQGAPAQPNGAPPAETAPPTKPAAEQGQEQARVEALDAYFADLLPADTENGDLPATARFSWDPPAAVAPAGDEDRSPSALAAIGMLLSGLSYREWVERQRRKQRENGRE
jgi:hypothetical protein